MTTINQPSEDIKDMLESSESGLGLVFGTDLFINIEPNSPDNVVVLSDYAGIGQERYGMEMPNFQVTVRNNDQTTGYQLIKDIKYYLHEKCNELWNNTKYISIMNISDIGFLGQDSKNRFTWSTNFQIYRTAT